MSDLDVVLQWCTALQATSVATAIRETVLYPIIECSHVLGLALSVGAIMWFDLRLLGLVWKKSSVSAAFSMVKPVMMVGFAVMILTGALLFTARASEAFSSVFFRIKIGLLVLSALNVALFHLTIDRRRRDWELADPPPAQVRMAGLVSLALWFSVIAAGRITAYKL